MMDICDLHKIQGLQYNWWRLCCYVTVLVYFKCISIGLFKLTIFSFCCSNIFVLLVNFQYFFFSLLNLDSGIQRGWAEVGGANPGAAS